MLDQGLAHCHAATVKHTRIAAALHLCMIYLPSLVTGAKSTAEEPVQDEKTTVKVNLRIA